MTVRRLVPLAITLLILSGCDRTPSRDQVAADLSARLQQAFGNSIEIAEVSRRGAAKDVSAPAGESRRIVYFDVSMRAREDLDLGAWDTPGAASLVSLVGAGPKGIYGIKPGSNKAGDIIRAHGSAIYRREADGWRPIAAAGFSPPPAPVTDNQAPRPVVETLIAALQGTIRSLPPGISPRGNAMIEDELARAVNNIRARLAHEQEGYAIAAGPEQGQYLRFVRALAALAADQRVRVIPLVTAGSDENLRLLHDGRVLLALAQGDVAALAYAGEEPFADLGPSLALRALGSIYVEPLHVIVRADSPIRTMADLRGRKINVGPVGSGSRVTALRVLAAHDIPADRAGALTELGLSPALAALRDGRIDAVLQIIGVPANEIRNAFATLPLRLVPLDGGVIERLANQAYVAAPIPPGSYAGPQGAVPTIGVAAILVATTELTSAEAFAATRLVFTAPNLVAAGSPQGAQVGVRTARLGLRIPMHDGAERALAEIGAR
jgi:TRAP transporter TAXI family solute receptor